MNSEIKICQNCKNEFTIEPGDFTFYEKIKVPAPTWCPECRYQRRLVNRNEWSLYRRKCDFTGDSIISIYRDGAPFPVYKQEIWWSDKWDPLHYGRDFDFSRPFFEQFKELQNVVPHLAMVNSNSVNSEYSNQSQDNKDCYMVSATGGSEKCMYGNWYQPGCYFSVDCYNMEACELCYESLNCARCYGCGYVQDCHDCNSCYFSTDLRGCSNCLGSVGLRNKNYCLFNKQLSKEEYEKEIKKFKWTCDFIAEMQKKSFEFSLRFTRKFYHGMKNINSSGDYLENTKSAHLSFNCRHSEYVGYLQDAWEMKDCRDMTEILDDELSYEGQGSFRSHRSISLRSCWNVNDSYYSDLCFSSSNLFGCVGLRQKHYCILNKQYTKEEYEVLKNRIIAHMKKTGEWGEYFPPAITPFAYNESVAQDYFPLSKEEVMRKGYLWYEQTKSEYQTTLSWRDLPATIEAVDEEILKETIRCRTQDSEEEKHTHPLCTTAFKIVPLELEFYRKVSIPLPQKCFPCRRADRFKLRSPRRLWHRKCQCAGEKFDNGVYHNQTAHFHNQSNCPNEFETSYAPERPEIIYCEQCYQQEVI